MSTQLATTIIPEQLSPLHLLLLLDRRRRRRGSRKMKEQEQQMLKRSTFAILNTISPQLSSFHNLIEKLARNVWRPSFCHARWPDEQLMTQIVWYSNGSKSEERRRRRKRKRRSNRRRSNRRRRRRRRRRSGRRRRANAQTIPILPSLQDFYAVMPLTWSNIWVTSVHITAESFHKLYHMILTESQSHKNWNHTVEFSCVQHHTKFETNQFISVREQASVEGASSKNHVSTLSWTPIVQNKFIMIFVKTRGCGSIIFH